MKLQDIGTIVKEMIIYLLIVIYLVLASNDHVIVA